MYAQKKQRVHAHFCLRPVYRTCASAAGGATLAFGCDLPRCLFNVRAATDGTKNYPTHGRSNIPNRCIIHFDAGFLYQYPKRSSRTQITACVNFAVVYIFVTIGERRYGLNVCGIGCQRHRKRQTRRPATHLELLFKFCLGLLSLIDELDSKHIYT